MIRNLQLVFDAEDPDEIMRFWGRALGYTNQFTSMTPEELTEWRKGFPQFDGRGRIDDDGGRRMSVYIQKVPEPKTGRNRLRLEIAAPDVEAFGRHVEELGAQRTADGYVDSEGNEFTIVPGSDEPKLKTIEIDASDPQRLLSFWAEATGYEISGDRCDPPPGAKYVLPFSDEEPRTLDLIPGLRFVRADSPKQVKNRLHLDIQLSTRSDERRDELVALGARVLRWDSDHVLADLEGNEFCLSGPGDH